MVKSLAIAVVFILSIISAQAVYAEREVVRGAAGGALGGAAIGKLSDGDAGKGAAWGAGIGAAKGIAAKKRAEQDERDREIEMREAYEQGRRDASRVEK